MTKVAKIYTLFMTKMAKKPGLWGCTYLYSLYNGVPPWEFQSIRSKCEQTSLNLLQMERRYMQEDAGHKYLIQDELKRRNKMILVISF